MIGYPGLDHVVTGGRGVLRARVHVHGVAGHSGSTRTGAGAITKAAHLIREAGRGAAARPGRTGVPAASETDRHRHQRR